MLLYRDLSRLRIVEDGYLRKVCGVEQWNWNMEVLWSFGRFYGMRKMVKRLFIKPELS